MQPVDGDVALVVVQGRNQPGQRRQGIRNWTAVGATVYGVVQCLTSTIKSMIPRSDVVSAGLPSSNWHNRPAQ